MRNAPTDFTSCHNTLDHLRSTVLSIQIQIQIQMLLLRWPQRQMECRSFLTTNMQIHIHIAPQAQV